MAISRSPQSRLDIVEIATYIGRANPTAADKFLDELEAKFAILERQPELGERRTDLGPELRGHSFGNYVIYYQPDSNGIQIVRVLHGARRTEDLF